MKSTGGKLLVFQSGMLVNLSEIRCAFMLVLLSGYLVYLGAFLLMHAGLFRHEGLRLE
jgi:hypothetical protein